MENIEELLPGIEEFLSDTLAAEKLSPFAEQRRLFFLERLDIVKLPPTVPPREGRNLPQELLKDTEEKSGIPSTNQGSTKHTQPDFAAAQREIARSWAGSNGHVTEEKENGGSGSGGCGARADGDDDSLEKVKVYDDIDTDISVKDDDDERTMKIDNPYDDDEIDDLDPNGSSSNNIHLLKADDEEGDEQEEENDYEIPVAMQQFPDENGDGSYPSITTADSVEELVDDVLDSPSAMLPPPVPPPLPPRRDIRFSDSGSRSSINGLADEAPPDLPYRPPLPKRGEICGRSERSDRSDPDLSGDGDSTSYESFDEEDEVDAKDKNTANDTGIKLPTKPQKKKNALKMSKKLSKSRSMSQWEISAPFRKLDNVELSGELLHKGKLTWNRRIVAVTNGCLVMYKPDKDGRPLMVIPLMGYEATVIERKEGRRGYEIKMTHPQDDTHLFSVDVKDWAYTWKEHINKLSKGRRSSNRQPIHLSRTLSNDISSNVTSSNAVAAQSNNNNNNNNTHDSKTDLNGSNSNLSTGSEGGGAEDTVLRPRMRTGSRVMRMGSFAFRATQFFENISKKSVKRKHSSQSVRGESGVDGKPRVFSADYSDYATNNHSNILEESSISSNSTGNLHHASFLTPTSDLSFPVFSDSSNPSVSNSPTEVTALAADPHYDGRGSLTSSLTTNQQLLQDVTQKGYLFIFSTFNRRRWGKRWCLVRGNAFECYRSENQPMNQCELSFLLKSCVLRRAVEETGSELGLMLVDVEKDKEKITVEPVCPSEMAGWVQVFMSETSTMSVPEGLEENMKPVVTRRGSDAPSLLSLSVLKQWDMDITLQSLTSSKESSSPEDPTGPWIGSTNDKPSDSEEGSNLEFCNTTISNTEEAFPTFVKEAGPLISVDNLALHVKKKHTTDSGFYSVKGNNSDSDGEHVDLLGMAIAAEEEEEEERENDNCGHFVTESHSKQSFQTNSISNQSSKSDEESIVENNLSIIPSSQTVLANSAPPTSTSSSLSSSSSSPHVSHSSSQPPALSILLSPHPQPFHNIQTNPCDQTTSPHRPEFEEEPEPKHEYSQVLKRSLRRKSKTPDINCSSSDITTPQNNICEQSDSANLSPSEIITFGSTDNSGEEFEEEIFEIPKDPVDSIYEDVEPNSNAINSHLAPSVTVKPDESETKVEIQNDKSEDSKSILQSVHHNEQYNHNSQHEQSNHLPLSDNDDNDDCHSKSVLDSENEPKSLLSTTHEQISDDKPVKGDSIMSTPSPYKTKEITTDNAEQSTSTSSCGIPEIPLMEVHKPGMNEEELNEAIENLKQKKTELKRKRLAVHDKRQRVSSDEERLACEKEFASLERAVESTDKDIGFLQNQLDALCGHSLDAIKINSSRKKSGSKKRKPKKKAHQAT